MLAVDLALFFGLFPYMASRSHEPQYSPAMVLCNLGLILLSRAGKRSLLETLLSPNRPQAWITIGSLGLLGLSLFVPWLQRTFYVRIHSS